MSIINFIKKNIKDSKEQVRTAVEQCKKECAEINAQHKKKCEEIEREAAITEAIAKERYERYLLGDKTLVLTKWEFFKFKIWPILSKVLKVLIFIVIFGAILLGYTIYYALIAIVVLYIVVGGNMI